MTKVEALRQIIGAHRLIRAMTNVVYDVASVSGNAQLRDKAMLGKFGTAGTGAIVAYPTRIRKLEAAEISEILAAAEVLILELDRIFVAELEKVA